MRSAHLSAALLKAAFEMHPLNPMEMAAYGGAAGGLLGAGTGALTGLIGTEAGTPERRKAVLRRALIGLLAGGGLGAAGVGLRSQQIASPLQPTADDAKATFNQVMSASAPDEVTPADAGKIMGQIMADQRQQVRGIPMGAADTLKLLLSAPRASQ